MTNYDESKLPKWAQFELRRLREKLERKPERLVVCGGTCIDLEAIEYIWPNGKSKNPVTVRFRSGAELLWSIHPDEIEDWFLYRAWRSYWRWRELRLEREADNAD